jgi:hypothetical protein
LAPGAGDAACRAASRADHAARTLPKTVDPMLDTPRAGGKMRSIFANLYLDGFDHFVTEVLRAPYLRYVDGFALFNDDPSLLAGWRRRIEQYLAGRRLRLHPRKTMIEATVVPSSFLGFELHAGGGRRLPEDNVRRFRNRLRGLRDQWRAGTAGRADIDARIRAWIAHAQNANTWRLRQAIFRGGWYDPARSPEAWTAPCRRVLRGGAWNNNPRNLRAANRNRQRFPAGKHAFRRSRRDHGRAGRAVSVQGRP